MDKKALQKSIIGMTMDKIMRSIFCFFWIGLWVLTGPSMVLGARVAGEEGVTETSPEVSPGVKRPSPVKRPTRAPVQPAPRATKEEAKPKSAAPPKTQAPATTQEEDIRYVTIDFDDVDIRLFVKFISELTGKNFVIDQRVKGKVTIISPRKITVEEAYKVFESVLEVHGFTTVPAGDIIKIVPAVAARSKDVETRVRPEPISPEDKIVTQLIPLKYADPSNLSKLFAPLISKSSVIVPYPPTGMLIVTDVLSNIGRLLQIVEAIDVEGIGEEISVVPLKYATASVMGKSLNEVFQRRVKRPAKGAAAEPLIKVVPDDRTNVLIILASEDDTFRIRQLIELLDKETPRGEGDIHVYYLQNANAEELAKVLMAIPTKEVKGAAKGKAPIVSKELQIVADKATNSLVITASKDDFMVLEEVIKKLDIARRMVYIEALFMEVDINKDFDLGVEWQAAEPIGSHDGREVAAFGTFRKGETLVPIGKGFSFGVLGDIITIGGIEFSSLTAVIKAVQTESGVHILSTPQIMTTDNEEAEIVVAKNIPFQTRVETTTEVTGREFSSFEYRDVGVTLNITPQINQERFVRLKISQEVSQVVEEESVQGLPTTLKRTARTTVIIKDGNTVVIGGLIDDTLTEGTTMTPCLGTIPGFGWFFKSVSDTERRTNLYIFLTPHIIETPAEADAVYQEKKEEIDRVQEGAIKLYEGRRESGDDVRLSELGYAYLEAKEYDKAKEHFLKALEINPENPYALLNMGVVYEAEGKRGEAIKMYERVISLNPDAVAVTSTDPERKGQRIVDIARDNLERLQGVRK
ncbi:MAG: type II secretion system secretin GspD [Desulfobacteraceae bacterium]